MVEYFIFQIRNLVHNLIVLLNFNNERGGGDVFFGRFGNPKFFGIIPAET